MMFSYILINDIEWGDYADIFAKKLPKRLLVNVSSKTKQEYEIRFDRTPHDKRCKITIYDFFTPIVYSCIKKSIESDYGIKMVRFKFDVISKHTADKLLSKKIHRIVV